MNATSLSIAFALGVAPLAAGGAAQPAPSAPPAEATAADKEKKICKRVPRPGTIMMTMRVCRTEAEWEADRRDAQQWGRERIDGCRGRSADPAEPGQAAVTC
jgi:hypothetical protein